jgi:hypothetical protein
MASKSRQAEKTFFISQAPSARGASHTAGQISMRSGGSGNGIRMWNERETFSERTMDNYRRTMARVFKLDDEDNSFSRMHFSHLGASRSDRALAA